MIYFIHPLFFGGRLMRGFGMWMSRGNAGWVMGMIGFIIIGIIIITED